MAYQKQTWQDEVLIGPPKYKITGAGGTIAENADIEMVTEAQTQGSKFSAQRMNHLEEGVQEAADTADTALTRLGDYLPLAGGTITGDLLPSCGGTGAHDANWLGSDLSRWYAFYCTHLKVGFAITLDGGSASNIKYIALSHIDKTNEYGGSWYAVYNGSYVGIDMSIDYTSGTYIKNVRPILEGIALGTSTRRWHSIFAQTGTINTSDSRMKSDIHPVLSSGEVQQSGKLKTFALNDEKSITENDILETLDVLSPITFAYKRAVDKTPLKKVRGQDGQERMERDEANAQVAYEDRTIEEALEEDPASVQLGVAAEQLRGTKLFDYLCLEGEDGTVMLKQSSMTGLLVAQNKILKQSLEALKQRIEALEEAK